MSFTNHTKNLGLPQWVDTDEPTWLTDMNNAFAKIDENAGSQKEENESNTQLITQVQEAVKQNTESITSLNQFGAESSQQISQLEAQQVINTAHLADIETEQTRQGGEINDVKLEVAANKTETADNFEQYSQEIADAQNTIQQNTQALTQVQAQVQTNTTNINSNTEEIEDVKALQNSQTTDISQLKTDVSSLKTKKFYLGVVNIDDALLKKETSNYTLLTASGGLCMISATLVMELMPDRGIVCEVEDSVTHVKICVIPVSISNGTNVAYTYINFFGWMQASRKYNLIIKQQMGTTTYGPGITGNGEITSAKRIIVEE